MPNPGTKIKCVVFPPLFNDGSSSVTIPYSDLMKDGFLKDLFLYTEDEEGKFVIEYIEMTQEEYDALPDA